MDSSLLTTAGNGNNFIQIVCCRKKQRNFQYIYQKLLVRLGVGSYDFLPFGEGKVRVVQSIWQFLCDPKIRYFLYGDSSGFRDPCSALTNAAINISIEC